MLLLKALFKIVFKWLFLLFTSFDAPAETHRNGVPRNGTARSASRGDSTDIMAEKAISHFKEAVEEVEDNLNRRLEKLYTGAASLDDNSPDAPELNDLRAELAELKADIRSLKRMMASSTDSDGDTSDS
jgi:hypothetical protein